MRRMLLLVGAVAVVVVVAVSVGAFLASGPSGGGTTTGAAGVTGPVVPTQGRWVTTDLGTLPGGSKSYASAINNKGQIVGWATTKNGQKHAVLWTLRSG